MTKKLWCWRNGFDIRNSEPQLVSTNLLTFSKWNLQHYSQWWKKQCKNCLSNGANICVLRWQLQLHHSSRNSHYPYQCHSDKLILLILCTLKMFCSCFHIVSHNLIIFIYIIERVWHRGLLFKLPELGLPNNTCRSPAFCMNANFVTLSMGAIHSSCP